MSKENAIPTIGERWEQDSKDDDHGFRFYGVQEDEEDEEDEDEEDEEDDA